MHRSKITFAAIVVAALTTIVLVCYFLQAARNVSLSRHEDNSYILTRSNSKTKTILLWTAWFGDRSWKRFFGEPQLSPNFDSGNINQRCQVTTDRNYLATADAVLFHGRDLNFKDLPPQVTGSAQRYIFFLLESPVHAELDSKWENVSKIGFHWIMSYVKTADIFYPYGRLLSNNDKTQLKQQIKLKVSEFVSSFSKRSVDAVWIVSNCRTQSQRESIVNGLRQMGITVDIRGFCSPNKLKPETEWSSNVGFERFFQRYRFYLSFENSLCTDYATEKLYNGFNASQHFGLIPVVYGGANYSAFLPAGSYIDVNKFTSVIELGNLLKKLSHSESETDKARLRSYYDWQYAYHISNRVWYRHENGWRTLCQRLWAEDSTTSNKSAIVDNVEARLGSCQRPPVSLIQKAGRQLVYERLFHKA